MKRLIMCFIIFIIFSAIILGAVKNVYSEDFSGEWVRTFQDQKRNYTVYYSKDMWRIEGKRPAEGGALKDFTWIYRLDKKVVWELMPEFKWYKEVPIDDWFNVMALGAREGLLLGWTPKGSTSQEAGDESLDGHPVKKYEVTCPWGREGQIGYFQWVATDLGIPLKVVSKDGSWVNELKNIKIEKQNPELFNIPEGYVNVMNL